MNLNPIKQNVTELKLNDWYVLFSYKTPVVAVKRFGGQEILVTRKFWSKTTSRHITNYLKQYGVDDYYRTKCTNVPEISRFKWTDQQALDELVA